MPPCVALSPQATNWLAQFRLVWGFAPLKPRRERMYQIMRKRNCRVEIYFDRNELEALTKKVRKSGLSREGYCRRVLNDSEVREAPSADVPMLIREVRRVGINIEQILKIANTKGLLDVPKLRKALEENQAVERMIAEAYTLGA